MKGWLIYGEALNEGRKQFPKGDNERFNQWLARNNLLQADRPDRAAAMWAAADPDEFLRVRKENPRVRTVRGLHAKWKNPEPEPKQKRAATLDDLRKVERLRALRDDPSTSDGRASR